MWFFELSNFVYDVRFVSINDCIYSILIIRFTDKSSALQFMEQILIVYEQCEFRLVHRNGDKLLLHGTSIFVIMRSWCSSLN